MSETLALIKQLHLEKLSILEEIDELTMEKQRVEQQINNLLFYPPRNRLRQPLRTHSCRAPSKFLTPSKISDELAEFLGKKKGTKMARTEVTREIQKYISSNNLQHENKRNIKPDEKLSTLFKLNNGDELTYFNLQRHITPHFNTA